LEKYTTADEIALYLLIFLRPHLSCFRLVAAMKPVWPHHLPGYDHRYLTVDFNDSV